MSERQSGQPLTPDERAQIEALSERVRAHTGHPPIAGRDLLALAAIGGATASRVEDGRLVAFGAIAGAPGDWRLALAVDPELDLADEAASLARGLLEHVDPHNVVWWVEGATKWHDDLAAALGLTQTRELLQMRRPLPVDEPWDLDVRPFRPGVDDEAWLEVNNRAFEGHPDQSIWGLHDLHARMAEPWFDPEAFLIHERHGRIAGFCWTKIHADVDPPLGEIHVIGADPDHQGAGLGRQLTLAGLDWLAGQGLATGMLYVEADNEPARRLYDRLGFEVHHVDRRYDLAQDVPTPTAEPIR